MENKLAENNLELLISFLAFIISIISSIYQINRNKKNDKKEEREKYLERCVLHYRDNIREKLDKIKEEYKKYENDDELREKITPIFRELRYYIHDIKFFDREYNTNYYSEIKRILLECETIVYLKTGDPDNCINEIKEIILMAF